MGRLHTLPPRLAVVDVRTARPAPKVSDPHYQTPKHRGWSAAVIRRAGGACQAPGCDRADTRLYADHIVELRDGGAPFALSNGQALCGSCHSTKTAQERRRRHASSSP
ncbi:HNH endonuclease [Pseudoroseomonas deserti]|uniref:HNH endonuclease n=2 Tax=Teichococcus deserti TaxID=1817963 RepID=A0A1V2H4D4_9PROT|nr:HNH endonuclease [Pseudoroseomonas deserti]